MGKSNGELYLTLKNEFSTFGRSVHLAIRNGEMLQQRLRLLQNKVRYSPRLKSGYGSVLTDCKLVLLY